MATVGIAIVGGGLGGPALLAGLRSRGFDAHLYESAPQLRTATRWVHQSERSAPLPSALTAGP